MAALVFMVAAALSRIADMDTGAAACVMAADTVMAMAVGTVMATVGAIGSAVAITAALGTARGAVTGVAGGGLMESAHAGGRLLWAMSGFAADNSL